MSMNQMIDESEDVYLVRVIRDEKIQKFEIIENIKGSKKEVKFLRFRGLASKNHFENHTSPTFWKENIGRSRFFSGRCYPSHNFEDDKVYLIFPNYWAAMKSAELIDDKDKDQWYQYVINRLLDNKSKSEVVMSVISPQCQAPEYRQFDFWIGEWSVTTPDGKLAGKNSIQPILNGCALYESWEGASGYRGDSINFYDRNRQQWHQTWIDFQGNPLYGDGGMVDSSMVLSGQGRDSQGKPITNRITWTPNEDGSVRQHWETSQDKGETWTTVFDGLYKKLNSEN